MERTLGEAIRAAVDATPGFRAYFAQSVQDLDALGQHIFEAIGQAAGAVVILHDRGPIITSDGGEQGRRSSVWVNQELAILAFRQFSEARRVPIICYCEPGVALEGAMSALIVNPKPLPATSAQLLSEVQEWMARESFHGGSSSAFDVKWPQLSENARLMVAALVDEGGRNVTKFALQRSFERTYASHAQDSHRCLIQAEGEFESTDLVKKSQGGSAWEYSLHPTWEQPLKRAIRAWLAERVD